MATDQPLLTSWATAPLMSAKMRISPVSWIVSIETDPRAGEASPPGISPWNPSPLLLGQDLRSQAEQGVSLCLLQERF